ncbi:RPE-retinal G protein-coupled receptor-like [Lytechinus pictus]|uniref:RPE-retinal G protein-coupled receptor-like n=1 Tax=Lytechinus pictus TaxID=7653 RepID=UPI0030BA0C70
MASPEGGGGGLTPFEHQAMGVVLSLEGVLGITASLYILISLFNSKGRDPTQKSLRTSLALGDLAIGIMSPVVAVSSFSEEWVYGSSGCQFYGFVANLFGLISIWSLVAMVLHHYQSSKVGAKRDEINRRYSMTIALIWGGAFFWSATPLPFVGWGRYVVEPFGTGCLLDFADRSPSYFLYLVGFATLGLAFPVALLISRGLNYEKVPIESVIACWKAVLVLCFYWGCYGLVAVATALSGPGRISVRLFAIAPLLAKTCPIVNAVLFGDSMNYLEEATTTKEQKKH